MVFYPMWLLTEVAIIGLIMVQTLREPRIHFVLFRMVLENVFNIKKR